MIKKITLSMSLFLIFTVSPNAKGTFKRYPVKSGMILYDINTTGTAPGLTTHTVGVSRLVFSDWGARELKEDDATEIQSGDFNEETARHSMSKMDYGTIYTVDFDENVTYQTRDRNIDIAIAQGADMSEESLEILKEMKAIKAGTDTVAGYTCDIWKTRDQNICIYKGIPLKITIESAGFTSIRTAQVVILDKPISDNEFLLPGFAVMVDEAYINNRSAATSIEDYMASINDMQEKIKSMGINLDDENLTLSKEQELEVINALGARYLIKQKKLLPKLMVALKGAKECLSLTENGNDAAACIKPVNKINEELGDQTSSYDYSNWSPKKRNLIVKDVNKEIADLNLTIDCVTRYNKTTDVVQCTEGTLEPKIN